MLHIKYHRAESCADFAFVLVACAGRHLNCFGPNINIFRDPRWGRGHETFGEDPYLTGTLAAAFMRGLQSNNSQYIKARPLYVVLQGPDKITLMRQVHA